MPVRRLAQNPAYLRKISDFCRSFSLQPLYIGNFSMFQNILTDYAFMSGHMRMKKGDPPKWRTAQRVGTWQRSRAVGFETTVIANRPDRLFELRYVHKAFGYACCRKRTCE